MRRRSSRFPNVLLHPTRILPLSFLLAVAVGTLLLTLPVARAGEGRADVLTAAFVATSAVCVTGLSTVPTGTYWSTFGHVVILLLIQVGGFGVMTLATLIGLVVRGRLGLRETLLMQEATRAGVLQQVRGTLGQIAIMVLVIEASVTALLTLRFRDYTDSLGEAVWYGLFHAVSAFNNAGFSLYDNNLEAHPTDLWLLTPIWAAIVLGGLGFPVIRELLRKPLTPGRWSVYSRLTVMGTVLLLVVGFVGFLAFEWSNPATIGNLSWWEKFIQAGTGSVSPRTAGFNSINYAVAHHETLALTSVLMFIGGGSAGTAGGIKVTTFLLLGYVILSEVRGERDVVVAWRRIPEDTQRQALTVALLGLGVAITGTLLILKFDDAPLSAVAFEAFSATGTVGLSAGLTPSLPPAAKVVVMIMMYLGRVGPASVAGALALRERTRKIRYPEERPVVG